MTLRKKLDNINQVIQNMNDQFGKELMSMKNFHTSKIQKKNSTETMDSRNKQCDDKMSELELKDKAGV